MRIAGIFGPSGTAGLNGLGIFASRDPLADDIQRAINAKMDVFAPSSTRLATDGVRGPKTGTAMSWLVGTAWYAWSAQTALSTVQAATASKLKGNVPIDSEVRAVQGKFGITVDGEFGPQTWNEISELLQDWSWNTKYTFHDIYNLIVNQVPLPGTATAEPATIAQAPAAKIATTSAPPKVTSTVPAPKVTSFIGGSTAPKPPSSSGTTTSTPGTTVVITPSGQVVQTPTATQPSSFFSSLPSWALPAGAAVVVGGLFLLTRKKSAPAATAQARTNSRRRKKRR